jgi:hypothetical protein
MARELCETGKRNTGDLAAPFGREIEPRRQGRMQGEGSAAFGDWSARDWAAAALLVLPFFLLVFAWFTVLR